MIINDEQLKSESSDVKASLFNIRVVISEHKEILQSNKAIIDAAKRVAKNENSKNSLDKELKALDNDLSTVDKMLADLSRIADILDYVDGMKIVHTQHINSLLKDIGSSIRYTKLTEVDGQYTLIFTENKTGDTHEVLANSVLRLNLGRFLAKYIEKKEDRSFIIDLIVRYTMERCNICA